MSQLYDSTPDTVSHINKVRSNIELVVENLRGRAKIHDDSKLQSPEKEIFDEFTPLLQNCTYMSPEYKTFMDQMMVALDHHYRNNRHHPQFFGTLRCSICKTRYHEDEVEWSHHEQPHRLCPKCSGGEKYFGGSLEPYVGLEGMNPLDRLEMLMDWWAAVMRHADGDIHKSIEINMTRFNYDRQTADEFHEVIRELEQGVE